MIDVLYLEMKKCSFVGSFNASRWTLLLGEIFVVKLMKYVLEMPAERLM